MNERFITQTDIDLRFEKAIVVFIYSRDISDKEKRQVRLIIILCIISKISFSHFTDIFYSKRRLYLYVCITITIQFVLSLFNRCRIKNDFELSFFCDRNRHSRCLLLLFHWLFVHSSSIIVCFCLFLCQWSTDKNRKRHEVAVDVSIVVLVYNWNKPLPFEIKLINNNNFHLQSS